MIKDFKEMNIPGKQTRVVIKRIPGRVNTENSIQLDLPLSITPKKKV